MTFLKFQRLSEPSPKRKRFLNRESKNSESKNVSFFTSYQIVGIDTVQGKHRTRTVSLALRSKRMRRMAGKTRAGRSPGLSGWLASQDG